MTGFYMMGTLVAQGLTNNLVLLTVRSSPQPAAFSSHLAKMTRMTNMLSITVLNVYVFFEILLAVNIVRPYFRLV